MNDYAFSLAREDDIPEIVRLYRSLIGTPGCTWDEDYPSHATAEADVACGALHALRQGGEIIAVASVGNFDELGHLPWKPKRACELARIGVARHMQNKGIGTLMLRHVMAVARAGGFDGIRMLVSPTNPAALAMYEKNGFERCGRVFMFEHDYDCYQLAFGETPGASPS